MTASTWAEWVKYNPNWADQPRVPSGQPEGGQWTGGGEGGTPGPSEEGTASPPASPPPGHAPPPGLRDVADHVPAGTFGRVKKFTWHEDMRPEEVATVEATIKEAFGAGVSVHDVLSAAGVQDGAKVKVVHLQGTDESTEGHSFLIDHTSHDLEQSPLGEITKGYYASRAINVEPDGRKTLYNDSLTGKGSGLAVFGRQVESATALGFQGVTTTAAGRGDPQTGMAAGKMNGYYTWPRYGYDAPVPPVSMTSLPDSLKPQVQAAGGKLSGLMATKEGRDWWRGNGRDVADAVFDLTPGSHSQRTFNAYLRQRGTIQ